MHSAELLCSFITVWYSLFRRWSSHSVLYNVDHKNKKFRRSTPRVPSITQENITRFSSVRHRKNVALKDGNSTQKLEVINQKIIFVTNGTGHKGTKIGITNQ